MSEVFYTKKASGDSFIVDIIHTCMLTDRMTVEYKGEEYTLEYIPSMAYYQGSVAGQSGFLV